MVMKQRHYFGLASIEVPRHKCNRCVKIVHLHFVQECFISQVAIGLSKPRIIYGQIGVVCGRVPYSLPRCLSQENQEPSNARKRLLQCSCAGRLYFADQTYCRNCEYRLTLYGKLDKRRKLLCFILHLGQDLCRGIMGKNKTTGRASSRLRSKTRELIHEICRSDKHHLPLAYMVLDRFTILDPTSRPLGKHL